jgi:hypothetical protein
LIVTWLFEVNIGFEVVRLEDEDDGWTKTEM